MQLCQNILFMFAAIIVLIVATINSSKFGSSGDLGTININEKLYADSITQMLGGSLGISPWCSVREIRLSRPLFFKS